MFDRQSIHIAMLLWGCVFSLMAAFCTGFMASFGPKKRRWMLAMQLSGAVLLLSDALAWAYRGNGGAAGWWLVRVSNFLVFAFSDIVLLFFHGYVCCYLFGDTPPSRQPRRVRAGYAVALAGVALVVLSQFTGLYYTFDARNFYHRTAWYPLSLAVPMIGMLLDCSLLVQYRKKLTRPLYYAMLSYIALPFLGAAALLFYYGISLANIAIAISMILIFITSVVEQSRAMARQSEELAENRISLMLSQMQPHFMYNVLNSIYALCSRDPEQAKDAIDKFSTYLRCNMAALEQTTFIPFKEEYQHIQTYLALEQMRFGRRVTVEYDIAVSDFMLPPLTIQPLVENAVRHGVTKKRGGGTVTLSTRQTERAIIVTITDTGIGFDPDRYAEDGEVHIGIRSVRERLQRMAGGSLEITSTPGVGTTAIVTLPRKEKRR
mgnify:CR=1 FL=1